MNRITGPCATLILLLAFALDSITPATAAEIAAERPPAKRSAPVAKNLIRAAAEVVAVDLATRTLTLKREDGNILTVIADKRINNLAKVGAGDIVIAQYGHAQAISLKKAGPADIDQPPPPSSAGRSAPARSLVADIIAIDDRTGQATLKGGNGAIVDVVFRNRKVLASVRIGDRVKLEYTDAVALSIKPAGQTIPPRRQNTP